ncbi:MAG TPA: hypothetical protein VGO45_12910 [Bacteroidia bacterium]|jgi:hypothetical protein|nr:hypothetical protein [Bacteroidia bacterium]
MRQLILAVYFIFAGLITVSAQNPFEQDAILKSIRSQLPEGWTAEVRDKEKRIVFARMDSVWTKHVNHLAPNAKKPNAEERIASFKKEGKKVKSQLSYRLETRWSADAIRKAEEQNRKTFNQIAKLPAKYKIEALFDSIRSEKGGEYYTAKTEADKAQIKKYEDDKARLLRSVIAVPFLQTEKYSLFPDTSSGYEDATTDVYPEQASFEWFKVQTMVVDMCRLKKP